MSEFEKEIQIQMSERVKLADLQFDGCNPNRLSREGMERLKASIRKWGDIVPTNPDKRKNGQIFNEELRRDHLARAI